MDRSSEILSEILDFLSLVWYYITEGMGMFMRWIGGLFANLSFSDFSLPFSSSAPTITKIFQNTTFCTIALLVIFIYVIAINISAFTAFGKDKHYALRSERRISERTLMRLCFWGGALGGFIGMKVYRHKTLKKRFNIGIPVLLVVQLILFSYIMGFFGFWMYIR